MPSNPPWIALVGNDPPFASSTASCRPRRNLCSVLFAVIHLWPPLVDHVWPHCDLAIGPALGLVGGKCRPHRPPWLQLLWSVISLAIHGRLHLPRSATISLWPTATFSLWPTSLTTRMQALLAADPQSAMLGPAVRSLDAGSHLGHMVCHQPHGQSGLCLPRLLAMSAETHFRPRLALPYAASPSDLSWHFIN